MPQAMYTMAEDSLPFRCPAQIHSGTPLPITATVVSGTIAALIAFLFELTELLDLVSIGTLPAYSLVSICILILRYQLDEETKTKDDDREMQEERGPEGEKLALRGTILPTQLHPHSTSG